MTIYLCIYLLTSLLFTDLHFYFNFLHEPQDTGAVLGLGLCLGSRPCFGLGPLPGWALNLWLWFLLLTVRDQRMLQVSLGSRKGRGRCLLCMHIQIMRLHEWHGILDATQFLIIANNITFPWMWTILNWRRQDYLCLLFHLLSSTL